jgi:hypothetical protein
MQNNNHSSSKPLFSQKVVKLDFLQSKQTHISPKGLCISLQPPLKIGSLNTSRLPTLKLGAK